MQRVGLAANHREDSYLTQEELTDLQRAAQIYKYDLVTNMVGNS